MHKLYTHNGSMARGENVSKRGTIRSQFNERALIHNARKNGETVVRKDGTLTFMKRTGEVKVMLPK